MTTPNQESGRRGGLPGGGQVAGAVLLGGSASRFGGPKALAELNGRRLGDRVVDALRGAGCSPVVGIGDERLAEALGIASLSDRWPGAGPLNGVITALSGISTDVVISGCDLARLDAQTVSAVLTAGADVDVDVSIAVTRSQHAPLARWNQCGLANLEDLYARGARSLREALDCLRVVEVAIPDERLADVDSVEDLRRLQGAPDYSDAMSEAIEEMSPQQVAGHLADGSITLFDVREDDEVALARVAGAVHIPMGEVPDRVEEFRSSATPVVICHAGGRSYRVCEYLSQHGIRAVNTAGGMLGWVDAGLDVETGQA